MPAAESQSDTSSTRRLVIRVKLIPQEPRQPAAGWRSNRSVLLLVLGAAAALLIWLGISTLRSGEPLPQPAAEPPAAVTIVPSPAQTRSVEPEVQQQPDAPPSSITEVIPDVPQSALQTIRGTIIVSVRVTIDKQGMVVDTTVVERGPSRYFERLAVEASRKWTFTPANSEETRTMLVKFSFTRAGATAHASPG